ncbi:hypothetical protein QCA50_014884 [Cerrena zonata]|uniref:Uncharacterized protein n=1 Tax=Cerrena zonata TaxID=2478898 RepID=A0AAW0FP60_9APHY
MSPSPSLLVAVEDVRASLGPVLLGSTVGALLSGIVTMQMFLYYKLYPDDPFSFRFLVSART